MLLAITTFSLLLLPINSIDAFRSGQTQQNPNSSQAVAIQHTSARPLKQCQIESLAAKIPGFTVQRVSKLERSGIVLLERNPGVDDQTAKRSIEEFLKNNKDWAIVPILRKGEVEQIPINDLIVKFKPNSNPAHAMEVFSTRNLEVVEHPTKYSPDRYVVRLNGAPADKMLDLTRKLSELPTIEYVEPVYVILFKPR